MLEINKSQLLNFDNKNKIRILKLIAKGIVIYKEKDTNEQIQK